MNVITKHPWLVFGIGFVVGLYAHRHRKEIIEIAGEAAERSRRFAQRQTENLEELVAFKHH